MSEKRHEYSGCTGFFTTEELANELHDIETAYEAHCEPSRWSAEAKDLLGWARLIEQLRGIIGKRARAN